MALAIFALTMLGCGNVDFSDSGATPGSAHAQIPTTGTSPLPQPEPSATGTTLQPSGADTVKVLFSAPPCQAQSECLINFDLQSAVSEPFSFNWKTNDTLYGTPVPSGQPPYGQPGVQYVPTGGTVMFPAGVTHEQVFVHDINPQDTPIQIGIVMTNCMFGTSVFDCASAF